MDFGNQQIQNLLTLANILPTLYIFLYLFVVFYSRKLISDDIKDQILKIYKRRFSPGIPLIEEERKLQKEVARAVPTYLKNFEPGRMHQLLNWLIFLSCTVILYILLLQTGDYIKINNPFHSVNEITGKSILTWQLLSVGWVLPISLGSNLIYSVTHNLLTPHYIRGIGVRTFLCLALAAGIGFMHQALIDTKISFTLIGLIAFAAGFPSPRGYFIKWVTSPKRKKFFKDYHFHQMVHLVKGVTTNVDQVILRLSNLGIGSLVELRDYDDIKKIYCAFSNKYVDDFCSIYDIAMLLTNVENSYSYEVLYRAKFDRISQLDLIDPNKYNDQTKEFQNIIKTLADSIIIKNPERYKRIKEFLTLRSPDGKETLNTLGLQLNGNQKIQPPEVNKR